MQRTIFDEDHEAFRATCRAFVDRHLRPHQEKHIANHEFGREVWLELGQQGLLGLNVPAEYGGSSVGDPRFSLVLAEELAKLAFAYSSCVGIHADCVAPYLVDLCTEKQKQRWLPEVLHRRDRHRPRADRAVRRLRPRGAEDHRRTRAETAGCSTAPRPSSPTATPPT